MPGAGYNTASGPPLITFYNQSLTSPAAKGFGAPLCHVAIFSLLAGSFDALDALSNPGQPGYNKVSVIFLHNFE